jgi:LDH2 family malate/lactate/ureidoglycolate dehydrogenase
LLAEPAVGSHLKLPSGNGQKIAPPGARCQSAARTKPIGVGGLQASKRFLGVDAIRLSGDRRLQAERTKAGVPLPMALLVKLDRLAEASASAMAPS